jgi:hypothetical protein
LIRMVRCEHMLAAQGDGAASRLRRRPHGDGEGAGGIGRRRQSTEPLLANSVTWSFTERPCRDGKGARRGAR